MSKFLENLLSGKSVRQAVLEESTVDDYLYSIEKGYKGYCIKREDPVARINKILYVSDIRKGKVKYTTDYAYAKWIKNKSAVDTYISQLKSGMLKESYIFGGYPG